MGIYTQRLIEMSLYLQNMGKMNVVLDDETEKRFREAVFRAKGMKKGNISEALGEAINQWIDAWGKDQSKVKKNV